MDLLIELIVWIFRSLFGEPETPADVQKRGGSVRTPARRGPYNYGDSGGGGRPKTLEEILEEVRREAAQKRGEIAPPPKPAHVEPPAPKAQTVAERKLTYSFDDMPKPPARNIIPERVEAAVETVTTTTSVERLESVRELSSPHDAVVMMSDEVKQAKKASRKKAARVAEPVAVPVDVGTPFSLIRAIRQAPSEKKVAVAREAVVLGEVFGPPRSRRPHVPGRRMF